MYYSKKNLIGQKFGKLTVISENLELSSNPDKNWAVFWNCQCDCGNKCVVSTNNLMQNHTTSCGCINYSIGEQNIVDILTKNNIYFQKEYAFKDLVGKDNKPYRFDFAILNEENNVVRLIEFDGRQHILDYTPWNGNDTLKDRQKRDIEKNQYAIQHHIPLIRIPYYERDFLNLQKLLIDTTYLVKE